MNRVEKMTLCGHSLGGYMGVAYAEKYPERLERLVLVSPVRYGFVAISWPISR